MKIKFLFNQKIYTDLSLWILVIIVVLLPLFKGGNYPGAMSFFIFLMIAVFLLSFMDNRNEKPGVWLTIWSVVSISVLTHAFIFPMFLSSDRFFIDGLTPEIFSLLGSESLSDIRLLEVWSYFTVMWLVIWRVSIASLKHVSILLTALFFASTFQAVYGLVHLMSEGSSVLGLWTKEYYLDDATGTFVNRNHFSGMLAISSPLVLSGLLISKPLIFSSLSRTSRIFIATVYSMFVLLALISAHSRMGMAAGLIGIFVFLFFLLKPVDDKNQVSNFSRLKIVGLAFFTMFLFATWFGLADILQRYAQLGDGNSRLDVWKAMFSMPINVWFFGVGPGQFEDAFQVVKPSDFSVKFIYAHNDYLEFVFEFGLLWSVIILSFFIYWFKSVSSFKGINIIKSGVLGAVVAVALHSLVDFNLQVPASALCFCFAVGLSVNAAMLRQQDIVDDKNENVLKRESRKKKNQRLKSRWPENKREWLAFFRSE